MSNNYRHPFHDYTSRCIYHITMNKRPGIADFGTLAGDCSIPYGTKGCVYIQSSPVGTAIKEGLRHISDIDPALKIFQYALMPDHLHFILSVEEKIDDILGRKLASFKVMVNNLAGIESIFVKGFNDQILKVNRNLNTIYEYLRQNPHRLAVRLRHPEFFQRENSLLIGNRLYQAYGNMLLLRNPFMEQVLVHSYYTQEQNDKLYEDWIHTVANGGVLISPFIAQKEKKIREVAETFNGKIILISDHPLGEREKPEGHNFQQCEKGQLLILAPIEPPLPRERYRYTCQTMNAIAQELCAYAQQGALRIQYRHPAHLR